MALLQVNFSSEVLGFDTTMNVIVPTRPSPRADGKWPVLYLLHGYSGDQTNWQRYTAIERYVSNKDLVVVMPSVNNGFYTDMKHGAAYWTFISEEVPTYCERMFPLSTKREDRYAAGLSMGGYGALKLGLRCPDCYAAVASLSGVTDMLFHVDGDPSRVDAPYFANVFGTVEALRGSDDDLPAVARRVIASGVNLPRVYLACGTEDFLYKNNRAFMAEFGDALHITYEEGPGDHTWAFWDEYIEKVIAWLNLA